MTTIKQQNGATIKKQNGTTIKQQNGTTATSIAGTKSPVYYNKTTGEVSTGFSPLSTNKTTDNFIKTGGGATVNGEIKTNGETKTDGGVVIDNTADIKKTQSTIENDVLKSKQDALEANKKAEEELNKTHENFKSETEKDAQLKKNLAEEFYNKQNKSLKDANDKINKLQEDQLLTYKERANRDSALLNQKKATEIDYLNAQNNYKRVQNENDIRQAKIDIDIKRQQSAWAYNKIGLGFSSGIINQSQQIATNGIVKIAELKAKMNFEDAIIKTKIAEVEYNYTDLVNKTVDSYVDKMDTLKQKMEERINETNRNIRTNTYDKQKEIKRIEEWAKGEILKEDRQHINDIQKVKDRGIKYYESIQEDIDNHNAKELSKLDTMVANGTIVNMTPNDIANKEAELGLAPGTINAQLNKGINSEIRKMFDNVAGKGVFIGNITDLNEEVKAEMRMGRGYNDAVNVVMEREIGRNKELRDAIRIKNAPSLAERKFELDKKKFELDSNYKAGTLDLNTYKAETDRLEAMKKEDNSGTSSGLGYDFKGLSTKGNTLLNTPNGTDLSGTGREQCGEYFNDVTDRKFPMGDSMEDKLKVANIKTVKNGDGIGRGAVWNAGNGVNGHVGIIVGEDKNGYYIKSSNIRNDGKISTDYIPKNKIKGFTGKAFSGVTDLDKASAELDGDFIAEYPTFSNNKRKKLSNKKKAEMILDSKIKKEKLGAEEINYIVGTDTLNDIKAFNEDKRNKRGFTNYFRKMRDKGVSDKYIITTLVNNNLIKRSKGEGKGGIGNWLTDFDFGDRQLYIGKDGNIYRADAFKDNLIFKIN